MLFLGIAVDQDGQVITSKRLGEIIRQERSYEKVANYLTMSAGRYAFVIANNRRKRVYVDPSGVFSVVYNRSEQTIASIATLAVSAPVQPSADYPIWKSAAYPRSGRFAFGYTLDRRAKHLLPNTFLDLESWEAH